MNDTQVYINKQITKIHLQWTELSLGDASHPNNEKIHWWNFNKSVNYAAAE